MTEQNYPLAVIASEMRDRFGLRPRQAWRHAHGWSQAEAADAVNQATQSDEMSNQLISLFELWPQGGRRPTPAMLQRLADVYGTTALALCDLADLEAMPAHDRRVLTAGDDPPQEADAAPFRVPARELIDKPGNTGSQRRSRSFQGGMRAPDPSGDLEGAVIMASSHEAFDHAATAETTNVSDTTLEQLQAEVQQVVRAWVIGPPLELFTQMYQVREKIYGLLDGHQWPRQTAELTLLAGQIVGLMGHASVDFGYADAGAQQARAAFAYGNIIGHNGLRAWTQLTLAGIAYYQNAPQRSVQHALRGLDYAPSAAAAVPLRLLEARARANYGDTRGAQEALAHAWRIREGDNRRDEMLDGTAGQFGSTVARQEHLAAFVPVLLGEGRQAVNLATSAISSFENGPAEERSWGCEAIARVSLAAGHALAGELDGTSEALAPVLALPATRRIEPIAARLTDLQRVLARRYEGAIPARDLTEQIEDFTRTTTARALPGPHSH